MTDTDFGLPFAWAPDAASLAVSVEARGSRALPHTERGLVGPRGALYLVEAAGGERRRLTTTAIFDGHPAWAGSRLVVYARSRPRREFPLQRPSPYEIRVVDSASGRDRRVLRRRGDVLDVVASPVGRRVAVLGGTRARLLDLDSGRHVSLSSPPPVLQAAWSPDGRRLALNGPVVVDLKTRRVRSAASPYDCADPDWSPDGLWLVCAVGYGEEDEQRRGGADLVLVDPATAARVTLTDTATARQARWRPRAEPARAG